MSVLGPQEIIGDARQEGDPRVHKWSPSRVSEWAGLILACFAISATVMGTAVKVLGLDTIEARQTGDQILAERLDEIDMRTWCLLWEVPAVTCRARFERAGVP